MFRPQVWVRYTKKKIWFLLPACTKPVVRRTNFRTIQGYTAEKAGLAGFQVTKTPLKPPTQTSWEKRSGDWYQSVLVFQRRLSQISIQHGYTLPSDSALLLCWRLIERSLFSPPSTSIFTPLFCLFGYALYSWRSLKHTSVNMHFDVLQWDRVGMCVWQLPCSLERLLSLSAFIRFSVVYWAEHSNMDGQIHNKHRHTD